jgi:hypothetical protein
MELTIVFGECVEAIYSDELIDVLSELGSVSVRRASHVEPCDGGWSADMSPVGGPVLSGFSKRQDAIDAEIKWLKSNRDL